MKKDPETIGQPSRTFNVHLVLSVFVIFIGLLIWIPGWINQSPFATVGMVLSGAGLVWCVLTLALAFRNRG